jgi:hypothetical protein
LSSEIYILLDGSAIDVYPKEMKRKEPPVQIQTFTVTRRVTLEEKTCAQCGTGFIGRKNKKFCSVACAKKASYWRNPDAYRESRMKSYRRQKRETAQE